MTDNNNDNISKAELLKHIHEGWDKLQAYLKTLTEAQLTGPTDAAGWTGKDHVIHLAVWEDGIVAIFEGESRVARLGIDATTWAARDYDNINAIIQQKHQNEPLADVMNTLNQVHERLLEKLADITDEDLQRPYKHYQPDSTADQPVIGWVMGNTFEHYDEHIPWIDAIVQGK